MGGKQGDNGNYVKPQGGGGKHPNDGGTTITANPHADATAIATGGTSKVKVLDTTVSNARVGNITVGSPVGVFFNYNGGPSQNQGQDQGQDQGQGQGEEKPHKKIIHPLPHKVAHLISGGASCDTNPKPVCPATPPDKSMEK